MRFGGIGARQQGIHLISRASLDREIGLRRQHVDKRPRLGALDVTQGRFALPHSDEKGDGALVDLLLVADEADLA